MTEYQIVESIYGTWSYHLAPADGGTTRGLCGAQTMSSEATVESWGYRGHLNERYCKKCKEQADREQQMRPVPPTD